MYRPLFFLSLAFFLSCTDSSDEPSQKTADSSPTDTSKGLIRLPKTIFPSTDFEITNGGIGPLWLGRSYDSINNIYSKVDTMTMSSEGFSWPAKKIDLGNGEWIIAETDESAEYITRLHTNSKKFRTKRNFHVGQKFNELLESGEELIVNIDEGVLSVNIFAEGISVEIDTTSLRHFYNSSTQELEDIPKDAVIVNIGVF